VPSSFLALVSPLPALPCGVGAGSVGKGVLGKGVFGSGSVGKGVFSSFLALELFLVGTELSEGWTLGSFEGAEDNEGTVEGDVLGTLDTEGYEEGSPAASLLDLDFFWWKMRNCFSISIKGIDNPSLGGRLEDFPLFPFPVLPFLMYGTDNAAPILPFILLDETNNWRRPLLAFVKRAFAPTEEGKILKPSPEEEG